MKKFLVIILAIVTISIFGAIVYASPDASGKILEQQYK